MGPMGSARLVASQDRPRLVSDDAATIAEAWVRALASTAPADRQWHLVAVLDAAFRATGDRTFWRARQAVAWPSPGRGGIDDDEAIAEGVLLFASLRKAGSLISQFEAFVQVAKAWEPYAGNHRSVAKRYAKKYRAMRLAGRSGDTFAE